MKISYLCHTLNASFQEYVVCQIVSSGHAHIIPIISSYLNFSSGELCMLLNFEMLPRCFSITMGWKLSKEYVHFLSCFPNFEKQSYYISNYVKNKKSYLLKIKDISEINSSHCDPHCLSKVTLNKSQRRRWVIIPPWIPSWKSI